MEEGAGSKFVGRVEAEDLDEGQNAAVVYSVPPESPFSIEPESGKIFTKTALDFEKSNVHYVVVTAQVYTLY